MDWMNTSKSVREAVKKYRYVIIVLLVGLFLMMLPENAEPEPDTQVQMHQEEEEDLQSSLERILSEMDGAGKVKVLLTQSAGERRVYQTNDSTDQSDTSKNVRRETVIVTESNRTQTGLLQQTLPPVYLGAVILCQGADSAAIRLAIIEAVASATGLKSHNISVLKMK